MNTLKKQQGLTLFTWILILVIAGFFLLLAFKVVPLYAENRYVVAGLKALVEPGTALEDMSDTAIKRKMGSFYTINNVRGKGPTNIVVKREAKRVLVTIDYEGRARLFENTPLLGTVDIVVFFQNHLDSDLPNQCCKPKSE